jgi:tRNA(Ile2) C34 agmatinyltransferase TiaS
MYKIKDLSEVGKKPIKKHGKVTKCPDCAKRMVKIVYYQCPNCKRKIP